MLWLCLVSELGSGLSPKSIMLAGPLARASGQVSDRFAGVCDKLATFSGLKTCLGQDSTITTCRDSASRFATGSLCCVCFRRASQMDFKKRPDVRTFSTLL